MPFRDSPPTCPRCRIDLDRSGAAERFDCPRCKGVVIGAGELVAALLAVDPSLRDGIRVRDVRTVGRRSAARLPCAMCEEEMEPVYLGGAAIDRCRGDGILWFDAGELDAVLARAAEQRAARAPGLLRRLIRFVTG